MTQHEIMEDCRLYKKFAPLFYIGGSHDGICSGFDYDLRDIPMNEFKPPCFNCLVCPAWHFHSHAEKTPEWWKVFDERRRLGLIKE